jgi:hypothetical protein
LNIGIGFNTEIVNTPTNMKVITITKKEQKELIKKIPYGCVITCNTDFLIS